MKSIHRTLWIIAALLLLLSGCRCPSNVLTAAEKEAIVGEVKGQFGQLVAAINQKDAAAWSGFYAADGFVSAIAGTESFAARDEWVQAITANFAMRESQQLEPLDVRVTVLAPDLAVLTSAEKTDMTLAGGQTLKSKHVFTMIWKKEAAGWKIVHSHESWTDEP